MSDPIVVERLVGVPPHQVYSYFTDGEKWARWQGVGASVDPTPGGALTISMPGGQTAVGEFVDLVPGRRVVFTWGWLGHPEVPPGSTTVEIELLAREGGTQIRLTHRGLPPDEIPIHTSGWNRYLPRLALTVEGGDPGPDVPG